MNENRWFRDFSLLYLERAFPRTFLCLTEVEKARIARDFTPAGTRKELKHFPTFLDGKKWPQALGFLPDLARLEYALKLAAVAPELAIQGFDRVPFAAEPEWYEARFRFDPAIQLLDSEWPLELIYEDPRMESFVARQPGTYLVFRTQGKPSFRRLSLNEASLIRGLSLGVPLGQILERRLGPDFDAFLFHRWIESGFLRVIDWSCV